MEKTRNYQLNQWAAGDKVQRVDFNADNAKIDAAVKANADAIAAEVSARTAAVSAEASARDKAVAAEVSARTAAVAALEERSALQTIKTVRVAAAAQTYTLSLSGISWSDWREVIIAAQIYLYGSSSPVYQVFLEGTADSASIGGSTQPMVILLYPARSASFPFAGIALGNNPQPFSRGTSFASASGLRFQTTSGNMIASGSSITVYGLR